MNNQCDQLIDYINNHLTSEEKKSFAEHLDTCSECSDELTEILTLTEELSFLAEPIIPPAGMKERVLTAAFEQQAPRENQRSISPTSRQNKRSKAWFLPTMVAALLVSLGANFYSFTELAAKSAELDDEIETGIAVDSIEQQFSLQAEEGLAYQATASLVNKANHRELVVQADHLSQTTESQVYQVWLLKDGEPYRAGTFSPSDSGSGLSIFSLDPSMEFDTIAITIEPDSTSAAPRGDIVLSEEV